MRLEFQPFDDKVLNMAIRGTSVKWLMIAACVFLGACGSPKAEAPTATPITQPNATTTSENIVGQIETAEALWGEQEISSYRVSISVYQNLANPRTVEYDLVVREDVIVEQVCRSAVCDLIDGTAVMSVPDLFQKARLLAERGTHSSIGADGCLEVSFQPDFHYPRFIGFDCPDMSDEETRIYVGPFEVLP